MDSRTSYVLGRENFEGQNRYDNSFADCTTCKGDGVIYRKEKKIMTTVTRTDYNMHRGCIDFFEVDEEQIIGGIDICPSCQARSEVEWKSIK